MIEPETRRYLIVNADDLGRSAGINRGVAEGYERGIVTSASLMVRYPAAAAAAAYAREHPGLSLGLHVDLAEWTVDEGEWQPVYELVPRGDREAAAVEVRQQLDLFRSLVGRLPTHLDSHQHVHREEPVRSVVVELADELGVPLRDNSSRVSYRGDFYGQGRNGSPLPEAISLDALVRLIEQLAPGFTELGCHPGYTEDLDSLYRAERRAELAVLCHPRAREAVIAAGVELRSFHALA